MLLLGIAKLGARILVPAATGIFTPGILILSGCWDDGKSICQFLDKNIKYSTI